MAHGTILEKTWRTVQYWRCGDERRRLSHLCSLTIVNLVWPSAVVQCCGQFQAGVALCWCGALVWCMHGYTVTVTGHCNCQAGALVLCCCGALLHCQCHLLHPLAIAIVKLVHPPDCSALASSLPLSPCSLTGHCQVDVALCCGALSLSPSSVSFFIHWPLCGVWCGLVKTVVGCCTIITTCSHTCKLSKK